jgi:dTDP-4-amino-4,6-dideoxygalactose transaminase
MLRERLVSKGISASIHYPVPIHRQPAYKDLGYKPGDFPVTEELASRILSLPMYAELTSEQVEFAAVTIREFMSENANGQAKSKDLPTRPRFAQ